MAYLNTSATDIDDLLDELYTFATGDSWSGIYNEDLAQRQIGIESSNCHIAMGSRSAELAIAKSPSGTDGYISMALSTSLTEPGNRQYWGHPGSLVTSDTDSDRILVNDLGEGPWTNVWFFSDASGGEYIHCVVQTAADRYTHFGFGIIDSVGMTTPDCAFACSAYHAWWPDLGYANNPASTSHKIGHLVGNDNSEAQVYVPALVLPGDYPAAGVYVSSAMTLVMERGRQSSDHHQAQQGSILDFFLPVSNQLVTGGTALYSMPWMFQKGDNTSHVYLGVLPGIMLANIGNYTPGETLYFGADEWMIFPWKRKGLRENCDGASDPLAAANTIEFAFAYKVNS